MPDVPGSSVTDSLRLLESRQAFRDRLRDEPVVTVARLLPGPVRLLLVTDEALDFSEGGFGLSTFIRTLLDSHLPHLRFTITLAHRDAVPMLRMLPGEPRIATRITSFSFANAGHFRPADHDAVMLFGFRASGGMQRDELRALTAFMNDGGGLFATGDHGHLGAALCGQVPRARAMRHWAPAPGTPQDDELSMLGPRRNDTNQPGADGWQFDDQSDATPQRIEARRYRRHRRGLFATSVPHPILCGPRGPIEVLPDHPHEGECVEPADAGANLILDGDLGAEFPPATDGGARPLPEIIAWSRVIAGMSGLGPTGYKQTTESQRFGAIAAYDGHRAGVGRVVTDATWHHFVNVNLIGDDFAAGEKAVGFASAAGAAAFDQVRAYYRNLAIWLARPGTLRDLRARLAWHALFSERVMEATLTTPKVRVGALSPYVLGAIGHHARDVIGRIAGHCTYLELVASVVLREVPEFIPPFDPWRDPPRPQPPEPPWISLAPLAEVALGAALVALREAFPDPDLAVAERMDAATIEKVMAAGGRQGAEAALKSLEAAMRSARAELRAERPEAEPGRAG